MDLDNEELEATRKLNGVNKENSIEEDIKIVKNFNRENRYRDCGKINNAIDNVVSRLERQQKQLENSISKDTIKDKRETAYKEYMHILNKIDRKIAHMKDEYKIRDTYAEFGNKRGRLEILAELLEEK